MMKDDRFAKSPPYLFTALQYVERTILENQINVSGQRGSVDPSNNVRKLGNACSVFTNLKGTPKYWQKARNELIAKVNQLGPFHIFFTLSCAEMLWSEVFVSILRKEGQTVVYGKDGNPWNGKESDIYVVDGETKTKLKVFIKESGRSVNEILKDHVVLITRIFDNRVKSFVKNILKKGKVPISHYSYRVEFQARGLPHIHGVGWIEKEWLTKNKYITEQESTVDFEENPQKAARLAEEIMSVNIPEDDEALKETVLQVQKHKHTATCKKNSVLSCRFGFPKFPSEKTLIAEPLTDGDEDEKKEKYAEYSAILAKARDFLEDETINEDMTHDEFLKSIDVKSEDYENALKTSKHGRILIMKRSVKERFINNYNKEWMKAWNANMDVQVSFDAYSVISYILSYVAKDETGMTEFLKEALKNALDMKLNEREVMKALKMAYLTHRQVGASEALYRINKGMHLKQSNIKCVFVSSGFPENRASFFMKIADKDDEAEREDDAEEKFVKIEGRSGKFKESITIHER